MAAAAAARAAEPSVEPECPSCAALWREGRAKVLESVTPMERPAQKLAMMILAVSPRLENVWVKCSPAMVLDWLSKADLSIMDKIDVLRAVRFHVHEGTEHPLADAVARYAESGVPPAMADFLAIVIDGKEGDASMSEYFHMLEVAKALFGVSDGDDAYYTVSTAVASVMMGM